ncbi:NAD(P)H-binding protein [Streptomyces bacillaris]|uniref:NAD(P)H-binding protein n=1 Tax=unclassified Streptomyces TaxID=2593676 RepID=UPI00036A8CAC|nr:MULTISPECIES: NAD(P)H-binding protein [unclassified Streptomyces]MYT39099.1 NAD(P)H-binding protein [Streptomyces sp. SID8356]
MILVTGATGNIGRELLRQLHADGLAPGVRALTRDAGRAGPLVPEGVALVEGDPGRVETLEPALAGVRSLFLLAGVGADAPVLDAARSAGVEHVVLVSSITVGTHPHLGPARANAAVERRLRESGMAWTVLRPTQFASNTLWWAESVREESLVRVPYAETGLPTVHPADIASVARAALTGPDHRGRTYSLTGPERITPRQQAGELGRVLGREVACVGIGREEAYGPLAAMMGAEVADSVLDLMGGDVNDALLAVRDTVAQVTGSPARPYRRWAEENADAFR